MFAIGAIGGGWPSPLVPMRPGIRRKTRCRRVRLGRPGHEPGIAGGRADTDVKHLEGKEIALIFEKTSTRTRSAFESRTA
jgi:hypothetical protein